MAPDASRTVPRGPALRSSMRCLRGSISPAYGNAAVASSCSGPGAKTSAPAPSRAPTVIAPPGSTTEPGKEGSVRPLPSHRAENRGVEQALHRPTNRAKFRNRADKSLFPLEISRFARLDSLQGAEQFPVRWCREFPAQMPRQCWTFAAWREVPDGQISRFPCIPAIIREYPFRDGFSVDWLRRQ